MCITYIIVIKKDQQLQIAFVGDQNEKETVSLRFARGTSQGFDASPYNEDIASDLLDRIMMNYDTMSIRDQPCDKAMVCLNMGYGILS